MSEIKYMDIKTFRELGFLFEANRQFFHPLGLALEVSLNEDGSEYISGVWDYRDDPEGMLYDDKTVQSEASITKTQYIAKLREEKANVRMTSYGFVTQPVGDTK